jgi:Do/DeqQ family serine protease
MKILATVLMSFLSGLAGAWVYHQHLAAPGHPSGSLAAQSAPALAQWTSHQETLPDRRLAGLDDDFALASSRSTPSVVYIKTVASRGYERMSWLELFFDQRQSSQQVSSGSGVIFSSDGYIVTNNHVIDGANRIEVIHGRRTYEATVVGTDPSTDLAVLKVESDGLPAIALGRSRDVRVGEWVLAVGNPFNLTSTVTAGIVSAKGRDINILRSNFPIESFIQTDAAINPGNSGGALVNRAGALVGINTAILSQTGSYAGYGFAVPVDIVRKVVEDLIAYGEVQKAFFGAQVADVTPQLAKQLKTDDLGGVAVRSLQPDGSAERAGLQAGDVIVEINGQAIQSHSDFEELISYYSPGEELTVTYRRDQRERTTALVLTNREGTTELLRRTVYASDALGADLEVISKVEANLLRIPSGVRVNVVREGLMRRLGVQEGFVVTHINQRTIDAPEQLEEILTRIRGKVRIDGVTGEGKKGYYSYYF